MPNKIEWYWPDFKPNEVLSPEGLVMYEQKKTLLYSPVMLTCLQQLRNKLQKPILINYAGMTLRGYRSCQENAGLGKHFSMHLLGIAADCTVDGMPPAAFAGFAEKTGLFSGIGIYKTFVHLDIRVTTDGVIRKWFG